MIDYFKAHPEMAVKLFEMMKVHATSKLHSHPITGGLGICLDCRDLVAAIEASNQPPEIRWCVRHGYAVQEASCGYGLQTDQPCEIWTYVPGKRE